MRSSPADTKVGEGEGRGASGTKAEITLKPMAKTLVVQFVPLQPVKNHSGADMYLQPMEDPTPEQVDMS